MYLGMFISVIKGLKVLGRWKRKNNVQKFFKTKKKF